MFSEKGKKRGGTPEEAVSSLFSFGFRRAALLLPSPAVPAVCKRTVEVSIPPGIEVIIVIVGRAVPVIGHRLPRSRMMHIMSVVIWKCRCVAHETDQANGQYSQSLFDFAHFNPPISVSFMEYYPYSFIWIVFM
jgi:hypothetical protein